MGGRARSDSVCAARRPGWRTADAVVSNTMPERCGFESHPGHRSSTGHETCLCATSGRHRPHVPCDAFGEQALPRRRQRSQRHGVQPGPSGDRAAPPALVAGTPSAAAPAPPCPRCDGADARRSAYAALLGCYLGDGCLARHARVLHSGSRATPPTPGIVDDVAGAHAVRARPEGLPPSKAPGAVVVQAHWKHWPCLFPQHGPGRKHERPIVLEEWQREIVERAPRRLPARPLPLRRVPGAQLGDADGRRRAQALRLPALAVHQQLGRHPRAVLLGARPGRRRVATVELEDDQRLPACRRRAARRADRAEAVRLSVDRR